MKLTQTQFRAVMHDVTKGATTSQLSNKHKLSERVVQRIKEAGTWDRWPYIVAKTTHGYMTPEYKLYLKRRGLPITPPAKSHKMYINPKHPDSDSMVFDLQKPASKKSWWRRLLGL